jgi:hypothetical protein
VGKVRVVDKDKDKKWSKKIVRFLAEWGVGEALSYLLSFVTWKTVLGAVIGVVAGLGTLLSHLPWPFILVLTVAGFAFAIFLINEVIFLVERVRASRTPIPDSKPPAAVQHRDVGPTEQTPRTHPSPPRTVGPILSTPITPQPEGRIFVDIHPRYLINFCKEHTQIQADRWLETYIGKWMCLSDEVEEVTTQSVDEICVICAVGWLNGMGEDYSLIMLFSRERWHERLSILRRGDRITVIGRIYLVTSSSFSLKDCELDQVISKGTA